MKTGQMLFVAFGGMMLGAAGTLAIQTGLVHYEVTLDIRPRGPVTLPSPGLANTGDPYSAPAVPQIWQAEAAPAELPVTLPPLDDQQVAEIVALREQIGNSVSQQFTDQSCPNDQSESFADHLRALAGQASAKRCPHDPPEVPADDDSVARGVKDVQPR